MIGALEGAGEQVLALAAIAAPLAAAVWALSSGTGAWARRGEVAVALSALPALVAAAVLPTGAFEVSWLYLGARIGLDPLGRAFLWLTGFVWLAAGIYALGYLGDGRKRPPFFALHGVALAGAVGAALAADIVSFYVFFNAVTLASYGLVVFERSAAAARAGRIYIAMAMAGDLLIFAGIVGVVVELGVLDLDAVPAGIAASDHAGWLGALLFFGFGVKAGAAGVHMWLPLAHPVAPTPASALLSGAVIKVGLLGWLRHLPLGETDLPALGLWAAGAGALAAFAAAAVGATQRDPKAVLAYSSVSQMGLVTAVIGAVLLRPDRGGAGALAATVFTVHHGLAKLALFLGVGAARGARGRPARALVGGGVMLAAAAMVGIPLTSGAVAKKALKDAVPAGEGPGFWLLDLALSLSSAATLVILFAFWARLRAEVGSERAAPPIMLAAFAAAALAVAAAVWIVPGGVAAALFRESLAPGAMWSAMWPVFVGALAAAAGWAAWRRGRLVAIPPGDVIAWIESAWRRAREGERRARDGIAAGIEAARARGQGWASGVRKALAGALAAERKLATFTAGILAAIAAAIAFAMLAGR